MAKTTSKTQVKTKTANKKPAAKAAAKTTKPKTRVAKTTAKAVKKPAAKITAPTKTTKSTIKAAETPKVTVRANKGTFAVFGRLQMQLGLVFALLAVLAGFFMNTTSVQVLFGHLAKDQLASTTSTVLAPAAHVLYEVEFRWLLVGLLALAAVLAVLRATKYKANEAASVKDKVQPLRWVDYAVTGSVAFSIVALLNGVQDLVALKLAGISIVVAAYLAWVYEREQAATGKGTRSIFTASAVLTVLPVLFLAATMIANNAYGMVRSPWYAYAAAAVVAIWLLATTRMQWNAYKKNYDYAFVSRNFSRISVISKVALAVVLIVGLYQK